MLNYLAGAPSLGIFACRSARMYLVLDAYSQLPVHPTPNVLGGGKWGEGVKFTFSPNAEIAVLSRRPMRIAAIRSVGHSGLDRKPFLLF